MARVAQGVPDPRDLRAQSAVRRRSELAQDKQAPDEDLSNEPIRT